MFFENESPFAAMGFGQLHRDDMRMAVISVRASYRLGPAGDLRLLDRQEVALVDVYEGDPRRTPMVRVGDLVPFKPAADVTFLGSAHAPGGQLLPKWDVGLAVGRHQARLRVHGPRKWQPSLKRFAPSWKLGEAKPEASVPIDYRLASGGFVAGDPDAGFDPRNPLGSGLLQSEWSRRGNVLRAPQIESPLAPIVEPFAAPEPKGFGPVPPWWSWRERCLGTRDEAWQRNRLPQMPADMSYGFYQTAHPDLVVPSLVGDERVELDGLVPGGGRLAFTLPGVAPVAEHAWNGGRSVAARLTLDGLHLDVRAPEAPWTVDLTWHGWVVRCPSYRGARLDVASLHDAAGLLVSSEHGLAEPEVEVPP